MAVEQKKLKLINIIDQTMKSMYTFITLPFEEDEKENVDFLGQNLLLFFVINKKITSFLCQKSSYQKNETNGDCVGRCEFSSTKNVEELKQVEIKI